MILATSQNGNWLDAISSFTDGISGLIWGAPLVIAIFAVGILLSFALKFRHLRSLPAAFRNIFKREDGSQGEVSAFGSLCTALSATIGTGNIVGVATAISTGGPGALFWMEVAALFGMATKYAEGLLAVKYREVSPSGKILGGPFMYIEKGLGPRWKPLAIAFAIFGAGAGLLGIGTLTQVHGITSAVKCCASSLSGQSSACTLTLLGIEYSASVIIAGAIITLCAALVIIGGLKRITKVSSVVVPFMAAFYITACITVLAVNASEIPHSLKLIFDAAFNPQAVTGGAVGSIFIAMQKGIARGIFSNEAGLGSAPIAAAAAKTNEPARQGLVCMTGTFIDTIVICLMTGLAIVSSGAWDPELNLQGVDITIEAFRRSFSFLGTYGQSAASLIVMASLVFFAFTTILGWNYYSEKCLEYLIGVNRRRSILLFRVCYIAMVFIGPYLTVSAVWGIADIMNGLMALPNLIALLLLSPVVIKVSREYFSKNRR